MDNVYANTYKTVITGQENQATNINQPVCNRCPEARMERALVWIQFDGTAVAFIVSTPSGNFEVKPMPKTAVL